MHPGEDIIGDGQLPNPYGDAELLRRYAALGHDPAGVSYLSLGETWHSAAPGLVAALGEVPPHSHGYLLTPYGLPALQSVLRDYIPADHGLPPAGPGADYDVAVSQHSTRSSMYHYGRLLLEEQDAAASRPVAVCSSPGWDYPGVYSALGYDMRHFEVSPGRGYQPDPRDVEELLLKARRDTSGPVLLILNAQHNPTGADGEAAAVRAMVRAALAYDAALLVDDAYYAVHDPGTSPTPTLRILLVPLVSQRVRRCRK
ncbi:aminotransferase class I/II-fold pyridoxal phosphate-dependent enzyme [Streptomyces armeniacus]|uniref:Aminotransferase class I/II-fold pyridoxal phosphate-dependent enzyme n=1 Tax=Streptomyces armeniacus TaxID=83291 RepID=A0A345XVJ3_9ACTN|nr:aminotransferase class I/II-fold pyridoxal phosphate-dependent enzyme [Streptomyces armeniacus]AXK35659.1 aminotransferase class I/II-fold pyridoxal phosphate-dependent enzyme [Streptomyces armeniacus]